MGCFVRLDLLDLAELELYRGRATENKHGHLDPALLVVNFFNGTVEISKRTVDNADHFARLEQRLRLRLVAAIGNATQNGLSFFVGDWRRLVCSTTDEAHDARGILDQVPSPFVHVHLDQHITWEELTLAFALLAIAHLNHFFSGDQNFAEAIFHASQLYALDQRAHDMLLVTRVSMHNVPTLSHGTPLANNQGNQPTEQGVETPQQQRHHQDNRHYDECGLRGFLAGWPYDFTNLGASFLCQRKERLAFGGLQGNEASYSSKDKKCEYAVQNRRGGVIVITHNTNDYQSDNSQPLEQIKTRVLGFSLGSHLGKSCEKKARHTR
ncbi:Secreted protein [Pseudomonas donghuensis]